MLAQYKITTKTTAHKSSLRTPTISCTSCPASCGPWVWAHRAVCGAHHQSDQGWPAQRPRQPTGTPLRIPSSWSYHRSWSGPAGGAPMRWSRAGSGGGEGWELGWVYLRLVTGRWLASPSTQVHLYGMNRSRTYFQIIGQYAITLEGWKRVCSTLKPALISRHL